MPLKNKLEKWQRIFVNRSLNMKNIKAIGYDMDHTLVLYNRENFESLAFRETAKKLIEIGYPEELLSLQFKPNFLIRGLLIDQERGHLLKVDGHKYVKIAMHGTRVLQKEVRHRLYNAQSFRAQDFHSVDTFFALSEVQLFAEIVDYMETHPGKINKSFREIFTDIRTHIDLSHSDGSIKNHVLAQPEKFINIDPALVESLVRFRDAGKILFLLTNSQWEYTNALMTYITQGAHEHFPNWRDLFDYVIVGAGKPGFFFTSHPFYEVMTDTGLLKPHSGKILSRSVYQAGNAASFQKNIGLRGDEILYVGDHIFGDIMQSKGKFNWRTALVVEELEVELKKLDQDRSAMEAIAEKRAEMESKEEGLQVLQSHGASLLRHLEGAKKKGDQKGVEFLFNEYEKVAKQLVALEMQAKSLDEDIKTRIREHEMRIHPVWGELMKVGRERSRFAHQIEAFACLYTSKASNFKFYSPLKKFPSFHDILPHDVS